MAQPMQCSLLTHNKSSFVCTKYHPLPIVDDCSGSLIIKMMPASLIE